MTPTSTKPLAVVTGASSGIGFELGRHVAEQGFDALMAGEHRIVASNLKTKVQDALGKLMPETAKAQMHRGLSEPGSASQ